MEEGPTYDVRSYQRPKSGKWPFILFGVVLLLIFVIVFIFVVKDSNKISFGIRSNCCVINFIVTGSSFDI